MMKPILKRIYRILVINPYKALLWLVASQMAKVIPQNEAYDLFYRNGYHLLRRHFYVPIPEADDFAYIRPSEMVGIEIDAEKSLHFLENELQPYNAEFKQFPHDATGDDVQYHIVNGNYMAIDGNIYYSLIRHYRPQKVVEIGSGYSTFLAAAAIRKNQLENSDTQTELIAIEPYPRPMLRQTIPEMTQLIEKKVQEVDLSLFEQLQSGDILFIDSTHVLRAGGDVWWEYCEILPRLASGVLVHIHDISLPKPYPDVYLKNHLYWDEQYLLQAFLTFNHRFEVVWAGNYLMTHHPDRVKAAFSPEYEAMRQAYPQSEPTAFWMQVAED